MADGVLFIGIDFARMVRFQVPETMADVTRWLANMRERESSKAGT